MFFRLFEMPQSGIMEGILNIKVTAIVVAAGQGKRMNSPVAKQFMELKDKPVLYYCLKAFTDSRVDEITLVTGVGQVEYCKGNIIKKYNLDKVTRVIEGGNERYDSVYRALTAVEKTDYVLIHDGARPFITGKLIEEVIEQVMKCKACVVGTPVKDTIKAVDPDGFIISTPDRSTLWSVQTPQAFEYELIKRAYELLYQETAAARAKMTDDAMVYETYLKRPVKMVLGDYTNLKLTTPEDFIQAQALVKKYDGEKIW